MLAAKRGAPQAATELLLARLAAASPQAIAAGSVVTWVPAHARRALMRPDAGEVLARAVAQQLGAVDARLLARAPWARRQARLSDARRLAAAARLGFVVRGPAPPAVVVVDDVRTTGATLDHVAHLLRRAGAREVRAIVVAATPGGTP